MLTRRVIPCLDTRDGRVVKGVQFKGLRDAGSPVELAARYQAGGADEIIMARATRRVSRVPAWSALSTGSSPKEMGMPTAWTAGAM